MPAKGLTPVQELLDKGRKLFVKRDDLFEYAGVRGGKARTCLYLVEEALGSPTPPTELVTAASRQSPQILITASIAKAKGLKCRVFIPRSKDMTPILEEAASLGAVIERDSVWHDNVIVAHAKNYCEASKGKAFYIPFGMQCQEAVEQTKKQVANIPSDVKRIVMPVGSGMSASGVLWGLKERKLNIPVLGVQIGKDPVKQLDSYAPPEWPSMMRIVKSQCGYHESVEAWLGDIRLDPIYEAKCLPFLEDGDLLWIIGSRFKMDSSEKAIAIANRGAMKRR